MLSPSQRREKVIRATDLDALSSRASANKKNYFEVHDVYINDLICSYEKHLRFCDGYTQLSAGRTLRSMFKEKKFPIINRGTYLRTLLIDMVISEFINKFENCQIISLGGGSDTRFIPLLEKHGNLKYHEIDFPESTKIKKLALLSNSKVRLLLDIENSPPLIESREAFDELSPDLETARYKLLGLNLRELSSGKLKQLFDSSLPTLVLSECVLCYISPSENESIIKSWKGWSTNHLSFLIYEPMSLNDAFGTTMSKNLVDRGIDLQSFTKYPTLQSRYQFLSEVCKLNNVRLTEMSHVGGFITSASQNKKPWIGISEMQRLNKLEFIDEIEEIRMLYEHYGLCYGDNNNNEDVMSSLDKWDWSILFHDMANSKNLST